MCSLLAGAAFAATFGTVVPIGGQPSDIALDEARDVVYVANYTANRIDVVSIKDKAVQKRINVAAQPSAVALSPDGRYLVITHLSNFKPPLTPSNGLTVLDLKEDVQRTFTFASAPMGVAFTYDGQALIATTTEILRFNPATGASVTLSTMAALVAKELPVPSPTPPRDIIGASVTASGDMRCVWGTIEVNNASSGGGQSQILLFRYDAAYPNLYGALWTSDPPAGPRVVSVNRTGSNVLSGWGLYHQRGFLLAQFADPLGKFAVGSHAIDSDRNLVYAQVPDSKWTASTPPVLTVVDADNLAVREKLQLKENLSGRSVLSANGMTMYSVSESGLTILPVGSRYAVPRVVSKQESVAFRGQWCDRRVMTQEIDLVDPGGNNTDFTLSSDLPGVEFSPSSGTTPAKVRVSLDLSAFQANKGTATGAITIDSAGAVNVPPTVRIAVNNREPDQRGSFFNIPGKLVDVLADPVRNRFYVLRQDTNQILVFDASNYQQIATLRTGNTPWSMAITTDRKYLIAGADNSQVAYLYALDNLQAYGYIVVPFGHYPRWVAASGKAILVASRVAGPKHKIDKIDLANRTATELPSLGVWENDIDVNTALVASPSGKSILAAFADGRIMLYSADSDTFVAAVQPVEQLSGTIAALTDDKFVVDNLVLNESLGPELTLEKNSGSSSGFAIVDGLGLRTTAPNAWSPGVIQRVDLDTGVTVRPTRMTEAPTLADAQNVPFIRSLAPLANGKGIVSLTTSGFTALAWDYDAAVATPSISSILSAADLTPGVAPGGLFTVGGDHLSPVSAATNEIPLPTALADSCMTINGEVVPLMYVSPTQINAQIPFHISGPATIVLRTPAGVSNSFDFNIQPQAPSIFRVQMETWNSLMPTVVKWSNDQIVTPSNPLHPDDWVTIYLTGLGEVAPDVDSGHAGPTAPLALALVQPKVTLSGVDIPVGYAGLAPGQVGVYQINAKIPFKGVPTGMLVPLTITQGTFSTTVNVRYTK